MRWETMWQFHTRNFQVLFQVTDCQEDPADSFEFQDDIDAVRNGNVVWFDCQVVVQYRDGTELGGDSLGCCAYNTVQEFYTSHWKSDAMSRNCSAMRAVHGDNAVMCEYFSSMVRQAVQEARKRLCGMPRLRCA